MQQPEPVPLKYVVQEAVKVSQTAGWAWHWQATSLCRHLPAACIGRNACIIVSIREHAANASLPCGSCCAPQRWFEDTLQEAQRGDVKQQALVGQMYAEGYGCTKVSCLFWLACPALVWLSCV